MMRPERIGSGRLGYASKELSERIRPLTSAWDVVKRIRYKAKRNLGRTLGFRHLMSTLEQRQLSQYRSSLPPLTAEDQVRLRRLQEDGTCIVQLEALELDRTEQFWATGLRLAQELREMPSEHRNSMDLGSIKMMDYPEMFLWGMSQCLLDLVENYLGLPVFYQGCSMRRDVANGRSGDIRQWHIDWEDQSVIKVIIYFNDVDLAGGCYEYIPKKLTQQAIKTLNYDLGCIDDETMAKVLPEALWKSCPGDRGTVIISDTGRLFHRAKPPVKSDRISISFCYTSCYPDVHWNWEEVSQQQWKKIYEVLDKGQAKKYLLNRNRRFSIKL